MTLAISPRMHASLKALALYGLLVPACNGLPTAIEPLPPISLAITGGNCRSGTSLVVIQGRTCELQATAWNANGKEVVVGFGWSITEPTIATVRPKQGFDTVIAQITGVSVGTTTLIIEVASEPDLVIEETLGVIPTNNPN